MLTELEVRTPGGTLLNLPFGNADSGYIVQDIEGLHPVKATLVSSGYAGLDGEYYQSSRRMARDMRIKLGLEPDYVDESVEDLRARLYQFFMPKSSVRLRFIREDSSRFDISGRVEDLVAPLFVQEPAADIILRCFDPDFVSPTSTTWSGASTTTTTPTVFNYDATVETGFVFEMTAAYAVPEFTIYHTPPNSSIRSLTFNQALAINDKVTISTVFGSKSAVRTRAGVQTPMLYGITPQSKWLELGPGNNSIRVHTSSGTPMPFTIKFTKRYGGL